MALTERTEIRMTPEQRKNWEQAAAADRRTLTDWIRIQLDDAATRQLQAKQQRIEPSRDLHDRLYHLEDDEEQQQFQGR